MHNNKIGLQFNLFFFTKKLLKANRKENTRIMSQRPNQVLDPKDNYFSTREWASTLNFLQTNKNAKTNFFKRKNKDTIHN